MKEYYILLKLFIQTKEHIIINTYTILNNNKNYLPWILDL